jgi:molybdenum cofactor cytidylyltransferase
MPGRWQPAARERQRCRVDAVAAQPVVIVLASGRGERFLASGGSGSKLHALLGGCTVLERTLAAVRASGLPWHLEDTGHPGMGDSIAAGVRATAGAQAWLILPGDLPLIQASTLHQIAATPPALDVVVPLVDGQRGHPVRFSARCGSELMQLTGPQGAAAVVRAWGATLWPVHDRGCIVDIDTLHDLHEAERLLLVTKAC